ncbi:MAG: diguanylate cyclase domain-containing protein [Armatimonadota bacterium]
MPQVSEQTRTWDVADLTLLSEAVQNVASANSVEDLFEEVFNHARSVLPVAACVAIWHVAGRTEGGVAAGWDLSEEQAFALAAEAIDRVQERMEPNSLPWPRFVRRHLDQRCVPLPGPEAGCWTDFPTPLGAGAAVLFSVLAGADGSLGQRDIGLLAPVFTCAAPSLAHLSLATVHDMEARADAATTPQDLADVTRVLDSNVADAKARGQELSVMLADAMPSEDLIAEGPEAIEEAVVNGAQLIVETIRDSDAAYRLGERRLLMVMPRTSPRNALIAAERITECMKQRQAEGGRLPERLIIGVAGLDDDVASADDLYSHAESALAQAYASDSETAFVYL